MNAIEHIFVSLDLSEMDDHLIDYALFLGNKVDADKITFIHVIKEWDLPEEVEELIDLPGGDLEEIITNELKEKIENVFGKLNHGIETMVESDKSVSDAMDKAVKRFQPDVVLVGNKNTYSGSGYASTRILEELEVPVMLVPETAYLKVSKILLPMDFSRHSQDVLSTGVTISDKLGANCQGLHVVNVPELFFPYIPEKKALDEARKMAEEDFHELAKKMNLEDNVECAFVNTGEHGISRRIYNYALKHQFDLIIVAAKGRNWLNIASIGGVPYRLANLDLHIPLLVLK